MTKILVFILPQQVSYFDDAVTFSLPDGWISEALPDSGELDFVVVNAPALLDDKSYSANLAISAFTFGYDPTMILADSNLTVKENVVLGAGMASYFTEQDPEMNPSELLRYFYDFAANDVPDNEFGRVQPGVVRSEGFLDQNLQERRIHSF